MTETLQHDVVIGSRIRLARNIADFPFVSNCTFDQRTEIESTVRSTLHQDELRDSVVCHDAEALQELERHFLSDLQTVTALPADESDAPLSDQRETAGADESELIRELSVQINEEDHLRLTVTRNDANLEAAWRDVSQLDDRFEQVFTYAYDSRWGYLTACPANVGTGMRASVMVHLPALTRTGQIDKVFRSLQRVGLNARAVFGERAAGDIYRISNQSTLGLNELDLLAQVVEVIPSIVLFEREAREFLHAENLDAVRREVSLAMMQLLRSETLAESQGSRADLLDLVSRIRLGIAMGILSAPEVAKMRSYFRMAQLREQLEIAVVREDYQLASELRDEISRLQRGGPR